MLSFAEQRFAEEIAIALLPSEFKATPNSAG